MPRAAHKAAIIGAIEPGFDRDGPKLAAFYLNGEVDQFVGPCNVVQLQFQSGLGRRIAEDNLAGRIEMHESVGAVEDDRLA